MLHGVTTFVIGAGASHELNLPVGDGLTVAVSGALSIDQSNPRYFAHDDIFQAVSDLLSDTDRNPNSATLREMAVLADDISANMPIAPSIDNYLNTHRHNPDKIALGKIAITRSIIHAERQSSLYHENSGQLRLPVASAGLLRAWHIALWKMLIAGVERENVDKIFENCRFVVFNYDRCLEHFFYLSLQRYFDISSDHAATIVRGAVIVHAYGKVGGLPWETEPVTTPFGYVESSKILSISREIRTFTESVQDGIEKSLKDMMRYTESVVFLGFGFIEQNMTLIAPDIRSRATRAFFTAFEMPASEADMAMHKIGKVLRRQFKEGYQGYIGDTDFQAHAVYGECRTLFAHHRLRLPERAPRQ